MVLCVIILLAVLGGSCGVDGSCSITLTILVTVPERTVYYLTTKYWALETPNVAA
jgi:hypothetical protein